jgi:hypothetical protein
MTPIGARTPRRFTMGLFPRFRVPALSRPPSPHVRKRCKKPQIPIDGAAKIVTQRARLSVG